MAVTAALQNNPPYPIYGVPFTVIFPMLDADGDPVTGETCDSERSLDGDTGVDCTNEGTEITFTTATNKGMYYLTLTAAELTSVVTIVTVYAANSKATPIVLYPKALPQLADSTATAGAAGTITLAVGSSAVDGYYKGCFIYLNGGTGSGQGRMITEYVGSTRVATIAPNWGTNPDNTSEYIIYQTEFNLLNMANLDAAVSAIPTTAMRGTDDAALASAWTAARAAFIDNLSEGEVALEETLTAMKGEDWEEELHTLQMMHDLSDDSFAELRATLTAIKGAGWTAADTLKAIKDYVDELESGAKPTEKASIKL